MCYTVPFPDIGILLTLSTLLYTAAFIHAVSISKMWSVGKLTAEMIPTI